ncbi:hypothetical protein [Nocardia goodfellowii]|uniref:LapA family protein n=1 Tax=Nocardia goodfellowii TaxID=882446 RepID=A0ABS4QRV9_9NOCA|nr:hypothetical protein [Nocardia goodfellowii]MBP2194442.1 hypothetical protein [Nocardia goodfellowii]
MIILIGLLVLIAAVIVGAAGVAANSGGIDASTGKFEVFDYSFTATAGEVFLAGIVVGAVGMLGLALLLAGAWRASSRSRATRRELRQSRREMAAAQRANEPQSAATPPSGTKPVWSMNRFLPKPNGSVEPAPRTAPR